MNAVARDLRRRAHDAVGARSETLAVAVAVDDRVERLAVGDRDLPIAGAARRPVHPCEHVAASGGRGDLAGVELISRIEERLDALKLGVEHGTEMMRHELG